jgi:molybdopterin converting factor small subunit
MKVSISSYLAEIAGKSELAFETGGKMPLGDFFDKHLFAEYPSLRLRIVDEAGEIRKHVAVFVGETHVRFSGAKETEVSPADEIFIFPAVSGG